MQGKIFREQAVAAARPTLAGSIVLATPFGWQAVMLALLGTIALFVVGAATFRVPQVVTLQGALAYDKGIAQIVPSRNGIVTRLSVREGQWVRQGDPLVSIGVAEATESGGSESDVALRRYGDHMSNLEMQRSAARESVAAEIMRQEGIRQSLEEQVSTLTRQRQLQRQLIASTDEQIAVVSPMMQRGYFSKRDFAGLQELLIARRQELERIEQAIAERMGSIGETRNAINVARSGRQVEDARLSGVQNALAGEMDTVRSRAAYVLVAPFTGRVSSVNAHTGENARTDAPLMAVIPERSKLQAELLLPSTTGDVARIGQKVVLSVDGYPSYRFGFLRGTVVRSSLSPIRVRDGEGRDNSSYLLTVSLDSFTAPGALPDGSLKAGMSLSGRIVSRDVTLIEWLLQPT